MSFASTVAVALQLAAQFVKTISRSQKSLNRFFPELAAGLARLRVERFVLDGELVIPGLSFETLQLRLHPAASRIAELSAKFPGAAGRV
jgi:ATP-dependent DNA ligase